MHGCAGPGVQRRPRLPVPGPMGRTLLTDLPRLVTTRGGAYCFLPSVTGIRYIASL